jgi:hypothetical protein
MISLLATDVSWSHMLQDISKTMPTNVWLTSFQGQVTAPVPAEPAPAPAEGTDDSSDTTTAPPAPVTPTLTGTVTVAASAVSYPDVASWLRQLGDPVAFPAFTNTWVSSATAEDSEGEGAVVTFGSSATLTEAARSNRLAQFEGDAK